MVGRHEIPTKLEVEDKVVFGMTARQVLFLGMGIAVGFLFYQRMSALAPPHVGHLSGSLLIRIMLGLLPIGISCAIAYIRPADRPLETWAMAYLHYHFLPKRWVWRLHRNVPTTNVQTELALLAELDLPPSGGSEPDVRESSIGLGHPLKYEEVLYG